MNFIEISIFILFLAIISVPLATRLRLPLEIFLVIGSALISFLPGLPNIQISPIIVFQIFLPPILFSAAYFTSWHDFKYNIRPITLLAFGLVTCTAVVVAIVAKFILPGFTWPESFLLGAIVSPSDISVAASIIKKLGAPRRFVAILEGESLINDATALILYRFSLIAIIAGSFSLPTALTQFVLIAAGGIALGIILGYIAVFLVRHIHDVQAETTFTFILAFSSYLIAERLGVSGVISTVTCGIYFGLNFPEFASSQTRLNATASWQTLIFIINGFAFALLGLELPAVAHALQAYRIVDLALYGIVISLTVILLRLFWFFPAAYVPRLLFPSIARRDPTPPWQFLLALGWTGMRGIVSLAAVLAIPYHLPSGAPFPHRDLLIFIAYCVIIATLIPPALTLPYLLRFLHLTESENRMKEEALARVLASEGIIHKINSLVANEKIPENILIEFCNQIQRKLNVLKTQLETTPFSTLNTEYMALKKLTMAALQNERETIIKLRKSGKIHDDVFHMLTHELDLEEIRAKTLRL